MTAPDAPDLPSPAAPARHAPATPAAAFRFEYVAAPESTAVVTLRDRYGLFVNGAFVEPRSGGSFTVITTDADAPDSKPSLGVRPAASKRSLTV